MNEGSLIMDHNYKEHLSDPPPQDTGIDQLLEENNRQEKEDPLPDDFSVKSPADLIVCPAPRPGVINLCEYDYTIGAPLDPTPVGHFLPMADLLAFCQEWAKHHGYAVLKVRSNANKNVYIRCDCLGDFRGQRLDASERQTATNTTNIDEIDPKDEINHAG
ncbi:hypothetical protein Pst134EA_028192 [Puccinia striiformis f. sp. tritici]|uniref:hypothetical protein n=1 Tax=Puccinia striiformis f. sp. tritici TaxID=168172 RepID=UPI002007B6F4|nr:hypothetical protein Pst134EA_028192 [Puccinia striiformis f. sp. tritici]KAH9448900.1 hypothetical protein Pst134EA_028192 [Puccinia striiformis f. sp. tritici]